MNKESLQPFCSSDGYRPYIEQPWSDGEFTIATDGKVMLKVDRLPDVPENAKAPSLRGILTMFARFPTEDSSFIDLPPTPERPALDDTCKSCRGSGQHFCADCNESHDCGKCDGSGKVEVFHRVPLGCRIMSGDYLRLIETLPSLKVAINHGGKKDPLCFKFDGGVGIVMPLNPEAVL